MTKSFNKLKKKLFLANFWFIFPNFGAKKYSPEDPGLSCLTPYGFLASCHYHIQTQANFPLFALQVS